MLIENSSAWRGVAILRERIVCHIKKMDFTVNNSVVHRIIEMIFCCRCADRMSINLEDISKCIHHHNENAV